MDSTSQLIGALRRSNHRGMVVAQYVVGDFVFETPLHRVYKCRSLIGGRSARVKVVREEYQAHRERLGFLANPYVAELHAASEIGTEYLPRHIEVGTTPAGEHFLIREPAPGISLEDLLAAKGQLSLAETISVLADVGTALERLHALGVGQINLHPTNIAVREASPGWSYSVQLVDLGGWAFLSQPAELPPDNLIAHPDFLTPEHAKNSNLIPSSDMFQMGVLFHLLLTGEHPLELDGASVEEALKHLGSGKRLRKKKLRDSLQGMPDEADMLIGKLLTESVADRPGTADMLIRGMELVLKEWQSQNRDTPVPKELWNRIAR